MNMTGCALLTFFIGYFHFLPLAKIPPVMINNSIPLSGYYFQRQATAGFSLSALPESQMLCAYLLTILWVETAQSPLPHWCSFILMVSLEITASERRGTDWRQRCRKTVWILPAGLEYIPNSQMFAGNLYLFYQGI